MHKLLFRRTRQYWQLILRQYSYKHTKIQIGTGCQVYHLGTNTTSTGSEMALITTEMCYNNHFELVRYNAEASSGFKTRSFIFTVTSYSTHLTHAHTSRMYLPFMIKYLLNRENNIIYHTNRLCLIYNTVMYSHRNVLDQEHLKRLFTYYHRAEP